MDGVLDLASACVFKIYKIYIIRGGADHWGLHGKV
jgi:hypothetical protein